MSEIIKTKGDALYEIANKRQNGELQTEQEVNEAWLRWFVYGNIYERPRCDLYQTFINGDAYKDTFPTVFAKQLVEHVMTCENCNKAYLDNNSSTSTKNGENDNEN